MERKKRILCVVGTRPEAIKMAPVIGELQQAAWAAVRVLATAQHRDMLDQALSLFGIAPDLDLGIMQPGQSLGELTARLIAAVDRVLDSETPDLVIGQGDTTTVFVVALCCFYRSIPFAHVEAGLRSFDRNAPFPEEMNRVFAGYLATLHFAPTVRARDNLLEEGIPEARIHVTGNTVIDALLQQAAAIPDSSGSERTILVTLHRRENFGEGLEQVCAALLELARRYRDVHFVLPVHPNPNVSSVLRERLGRVPSITLTDPMDYDDFVRALKGAYIVLTDSGGVQEEAPALGKPVLVMREVTERPEAVELGVARLVGVDRDTIVSETARLLDDGDLHARMSKGGSPYGDGTAALRIAGHLREWFFPADGSTAPAPTMCAPKPGG